MPVTPVGRKRDISDELAAHRIVDQGRRYWAGIGTSTGKTSGIRWGIPGDFDECVTRVAPHLGAGAPGYCQERHIQATGYPAGKAPGEQGR